MAKIKSARVAAAHEGDAELVVTIEYENCGSTDVSLDSAASQALLASCNATKLDELIGAGWHHVKDALSLSYNRFE